MNRLLLAASLFLSSTALADVAPGPGCDCSTTSSVPLALLAALALWAARQK
jgi:MYXO-CTERM domain-containing protein